MKGAATDVSYFARSKFLRSLVHRKNFDMTGSSRIRFGGVKIGEIK